MQMYADLNKDTLNQNLSCDLWGGFTGPTCFPGFWEVRGWRCYASGRGEFHVRAGQVMTNATLSCLAVLDMPLQSNNSVIQW